MSKNFLVFLNRPLQTLIRTLIRNFHWYLFNKKLNYIARFIKKHQLYPVMLNEDLLEIWERNKGFKP